MKKNGISLLEQLVRETVEGSFGRLFGSVLEPAEVATQLVRAMEDNSSRSDQLLVYVVSLNPVDCRALLENNPGMEDRLGTAAWEMGRRYGLPVYAKPNIMLVEDGRVRRGSVRVDVRSEAAVGDTTQLGDGKGAAQKALNGIEALDAFLIIQGKKHVALDKPLVTIGRRPDNDIVIDAPTVSRQHAQIRWRFDRFVIYDVSGRGRTKINGEPISERVLAPGDVIALSDVLLVYAEGAERDSERAAGESGANDTQVFPRI
jgi:FHA domain/FhaA, N-terminal domain